MEIDDYVRLRTHEGLEAQTVDKIKRTLSLLLAVCGDMYVSAITQGDILRLQEFLLWTPNGAASKTRLKTHTPDQLIAAGKAANLPRPAPQTLDLHRRLLKTFFKNLVDQGILGHTPMACWKKPRDERIHDPGHLSWREIEQMSSGGERRLKTHHSHELTDLVEEAQLRWVEVGLEQFDSVFRFRIGGQRCRAWGYIVQAHFQLVWWDRTHNIFPVDPN